MIRITQFLRDQNAENNGMSVSWTYFGLLHHKRVNLKKIRYLVKPRESKCEKNNLAFKCSILSPCSIICLQRKEK